MPILDGPDPNPLMQPTTEGLARKPHAVYRLFSADNRLLYIGCTSNLGQRLYSHLGLGLSTEVAFITLEWHSGLSTARTAEARAIETEKPQYNVRREKYNHPVQAKTSDGDDAT